MLGLMLAMVTAAPEQDGVWLKQQSTFYPAHLVERVRANVADDPWAAEVGQTIVAAAEPWLAKSDDELWDLMFGNTIQRSWMVWSDGYCPACQQPVVMYNWHIDALARPWKVECPRCQAVFPTNDFSAFYRSGLDETGVFQPDRADRSLLFNAAHPDPHDPLHTFGVDDGEGYVADGHRWRFIGAYLIYGQWKQAIVQGVSRLAAAYVITGDQRYAHQVGVLLDRVADLYPSHDFKREGIVYERQGDAGYVSTWHDACEETREMVLAYDQVFTGLQDDPGLVAFLSAKAKEHGLANPKASMAEVRRNIEAGLIRDPLANASKIQTNYPRQPIALSILHAVLGSDEDRAQADQLVADLVQRATAVDGVTGEKGLAGYASFTIQALAAFLAEWERVQPGYLAAMIERYPNLRQSWRFHIDTTCLGRYYPESGDTGSFAHSADRYVGVLLGGSNLVFSSLAPSMETFLWQLAKLTGDPAYLQVLYRHNRNSIDGLPHDLFCDDAAAVQRDVAEAVAEFGPEPKLGSVDKQGWHLAILRSGEGDQRRAAWLDYDAGGGHGHQDGMNLGLFAHGLDLLPDFGYPPVNFGGWGSPRAVWYRMTAAHNTVVIDGKSQVNAAGKTTLWASGKAFQAIRASAPALYDVPQYERTVALVDVSDEAFYLLDVFRVVGGGEHLKLQHSHFGALTTTGVNLSPIDDYGHGTQMRNFRADPHPQPGWTADWKVDDRLKLLPAGRDVHLRTTDLTTGGEAITAEAWILAGGFNANDDTWIPRIGVRRTGEAPLASAFVAVDDPYEGKPNINAARRLPLTTSDGAALPDANVAVLAELADGRKDLLVAVDVENPQGLQPDAKAVCRQPDLGVETDGELAFVRWSADGKPERLVLCHGHRMKVGDLELTVKEGTPFVELRLDGDGAVVEGGAADAVERWTVGGRDGRVRTDD